MVDAAWLTALADSGEILPRCQDVPDVAKVRLEEMEASYSTILLLRS